MDAISVYRRTTSLDADPFTSFVGVLRRVKEQLSDEEYDEDDLRQLIAILLSNVVRDEYEQFLELFDKIPRKILGFLAEAYQDDFQPVLEAYVEALDPTVGEREFSYAETVVRKMRPVAVAENATPELRALALEAALIPIDRFR